MNSENPDSLPITEQENFNTRRLSSLPPREIVRLMNEEEQVVMRAMHHAEEGLAIAGAKAAEAFQSGGRVIYVYG